MIGSVIGLFDKGGAYKGGYSYSPYGESRAATDNSVIAANPIRYIGGYLDSASGMYKLGARYFDPSQGRFTQFDPSGQEGNPYAYASCNPINNVDPSGLNCFSAVAWAAISLGLTAFAAAGLEAAIAAAIATGGVASPFAIVAVLGFSIGVASTVATVADAIVECS